jgi:TetR/AcrR family transcriptional regulator, transcriptional repressor for nem operon
MARPKEFERESALASAKKVFWRQGYNGTTTDDLRLAMGIGRQSFYDTFKSKREVFLEVLDRYNSDRGARLSGIVQSHESALKVIEAVLTDVSEEDAETRALGCLGISSVCEFGTSDAKVSDANQRAGVYWVKTFGSRRRWGGRCCSWLPRMRRSRRGRS